MFNFSDNDAFTSIVGHSPALESVIRTAQIAAAADVHILIEGETGTGKELMAQALQQSSKRADKPFVILNCAALPAELVESLMFGHEKGAFTGANERKDGYVQNASGGTLFLDEIGELPLSLQSKLLRFVENGECQRLGSHQHVNYHSRYNRNYYVLSKTANASVSVLTSTKPSMSGSLPPPIRT